jgi:hypothetical protein
VIHPQGLLQLHFEPGNSPQQHPKNINMGLQRRKANQLSEAEAQAHKEMAAERQHSSGSKQQRPPQQPRSPYMSYLTTVILACLFWLIFQQLHKHAAHLA